jgi:hypothetical protein
VPIVSCKHCGSPFEADSRRSKICTPTCYRAKERAYAREARLSWSQERRRAYALVQSAIYSGRLKREPCEVCGKARTQAHHDDYSKPLEVRWLCRSHHKQHHDLMGPAASAWADR